jgi:prepilin-type N-terminal cleavage/methylation domain-containing protein
VADQTSPHGFTLVELLVVLAIIGVLIALLLPAVQSARESARLAKCQSHLAQLGLACQLHVDAYGHFPTGGWGFKATGDADRGFGREQPGGWLYNVLPLIEQQALRELGRGQSAADRLAAAALVAQTPLPIAYCPTRRPPARYPYTGSFQPFNSAPVSQVAKTCYAANAGDLVTGGSPGSYAEAEGYDWTGALQATGLIHARSAVRPAVVTDGLSKTYVLGEKRTTVGGYDWGDDQHAFVGHGTDGARFTSVELPPKPDAPDGPDAPSNLTRRFGSSHAAGCQFAMADGSVRIVAYDIDPMIHRAAGNRADGGTYPGE